MATILSDRGGDVELVPKSPFMSSWQSVTVGGVELNNGYHVFDMPRSRSMVEFLEKLTGLKARIERKSVFMLIDGHLVSSTKGIEEWPPALTIKYRLRELLNANTAFEIQDKSKPYTRMLARLSARFTERWEESSHLFFPFFFPTEFLTISPHFDEGEDFRATTRISANPSVAVFEGGSMSALRERVHRDAASKFGLGSTIAGSESLSRAESSFNPLAGDRSFFLAVFKASTPIRQKLNSWDEILVADDRFTELNRIWFPSESEPSLVACEIYSRDIAFDSSYGNLRGLLAILSECLKVDPSDLSLLGCERTRQINITRLGGLKLWEQDYKVSFSPDQCEITVHSLGTANMNKVWLAATRAADLALKGVNRSVKE